MTSDQRNRLVWTASLVVALCLWWLSVAVQQQLEAREHRARQLAEAEQHLEFLTRLLQQQIHAGQTATELLLSNPANAHNSFDHFAPFILSTSEAFDFTASIDRIADSERPTLEATQGQGFREFRQQHLVPAMQRPVYFPVAQQYPDDSKALPVRLDLAAQPDLARALSKAFANGQPVLARIQAGNLQRLALFFVPKAFPQPRLVAFGLNLDVLLASALPATASSEPLRLRLLINDRQQPVLADTHSSLPPPVPALISSTRIIGGQQLTFELSPVNGDWMVSPPHLLMSGIFVLAILVVMGAGMYLSRRTLIALREQASQQQTLQEDNAQLRAAHARLQDKLHPMQSNVDRAQALLDNASDAMLLFDTDGQVLQVNHAVTQLIGQPATQLLHLPAGALISELHPGPDTSFATHIARLPLHPFEAMLICDQHFMLQVELSLSRIEPALSAPFYVAICRNISARKEREEALIRLKDSLAEQVETQSRQLVALLEASPMAMSYIVNRHFKQVNKAFLDLFGHPEASVLEQSTRLLYDSEEHFLRTGHSLYPQLNHGSVSQEEIRLRCGNGDTIWVRMYGRAVKPGHPELGSVWLYQDISAQRQTEDALRHARDLAEETSRAKTEFLANMSHELRTPLHAILGFAEMGQHQAETGQPQKLGRFFERIHHSGSRLLSLLNDLLDLSKMEVGRMEYQMQRGDLQQVILDSLEELRSLTIKPAIMLLFHPETEPVSVEMDAFRIGQVVRNLLSNAIKFSPHGSRIDIHLSVPQSRLEHITVSIRDHGPGVPEAERNRIFDKFTQSSATKTGAGGTGLGLAISREIIHAHQGSIQVENMPDGGACFSFTLPRTQGMPRPFRENT